MAFRNPSRRAPKPLDAARLEELALAYVARFATSAAKLERYLRRKLRERGWQEDRDAPIADLVARFVAAGYVDDLAFAQAKSGSLLRRGYGARRIDQALAAAGICETEREILFVGLAEQRQSALTFARRRKFGPFSSEPPDRKLRQKHIAAMLRAGHSPDIVRDLLDCPTIEAAGHWAETEGSME